MAQRHAPQGLADTRTGVKRSKPIAKADSHQLTPLSLPVRQSETITGASKVSEEENVKGRPGTDHMLEIIWPETGLHTIAELPVREKDELTEGDQIELTIDFVTLSLSPIEFIQLASFLRMSIDGLLERHPGYQRTVVNAFDLRD
jgi:hypothetical protein